METTTAQQALPESAASGGDAATGSPMRESAAEAPATTGVPAAASSGAAPGIDVARMEQLVIDALHSIYDPEIPVDIYELGLIYNIDVQRDGKIAITMTLTTPACPVAGSMPGQVEKTVRLIDGVTDVVVDLVWEPTWGPAMMTEAARLQLNMY